MNILNKITTANIAVLAIIAITGALLFVHYSDQLLTGWLTIAASGMGWIFGSKKQ